jgi:hypothetical protein
MPNRPARISRKSRRAKKTKPIDTWLQLVGVAVGIFCFLFAKTPLSVTLCAIAIFVLLIHPVWNFWWVENYRGRQIFLTFWLAVGCCLVAYLAWPNPADNTEGELVARESLPDVKAGSYMVEIGRKSRLILPENLHEPIAILADKLRCDIGNDRNILFSTTVRGRDGNLIVEIHQNKWRVSNQPNVSWDKNYNDDTIEVLDGRGRVVLQVRLFRNGVQIQGEWHHENGEGVRVSQNKDGEGTVDPVDPMHDEHPIERKFKYPSKGHWGELETKPLPSQ